MRVPSYQIYNILNIYSKWVSEKRASSMEGLNGAASRLDSPGILKDRYRTSIMHKVTGNIISKITCLKSNDKQSQQIAEELKDYGSKNEKTDVKNGETLVFNFIDENNEKSMHILLIDKSSFLSK